MANLMLKKTFIDSKISINAQLPLELTEGQKACLRLVAQHYTSKEIARELGISHFTVDQRLDAARRKLNAPSRKDAAKIFAAFERRAISQPFVYETSQPLVYETLPLEPSQFDVNQSSTPDRKKQKLAALFSLHLLPPIGGERHELSNREVLVHVLNIAFFSTLVMAFVVVVLTGTFRLFQ
jgi:DNA-binding CsgD family transcriptional regulator